MDISIIIPTLNEEKHIGSLLAFLTEMPETVSHEIICVDGGSTDRTCEIIGQYEAVKLMLMKEGHRAKQMNYAAACCDSKILYFLHADTRPPDTFLIDVFGAYQARHFIGCYPFSFDGDRKNLRLNSFFTRFSWLISRGGDQSLFVSRDLFESLGGYDESFDIMEEYDFIKRARKKQPFHILKKGSITVSDRKYEHNSYARVNFANALVFSLYRLGVSPSRLKRLYFRLLDHPKAIK